MTQSTHSYLQGSIRAHLLRMTASGGFGLLALFAVDLADLFFISLLGEQELAAAVGFAGSLMFFMQAISIGLSIGVGATVAKALGSDELKKAGQLIVTGIFMVLVISGSICLVVWLFREPLLSAMGAQGKTLELASHYVAIILPWFPLLAIGMSTGGVMRAQGDGKGALWLTLSGAIVNAVLDPILIFAFGWGLTGAAIASVISRIVIFGYGMYKVAYQYKMLEKPAKSEIKQQVNLISQIAFPSLLTNLATPVGIAYVTAQMAQYGDSAIAANAVISRLQMVAFVGLYAMSSVVGPIASQNWGAKQLDRVKQVLNESIRFTVLYCLVVCGLLALLTYPITLVFQTSEQASVLIKWFTYGLSLTFIFNGIIFVTNALFNNLGAPKTSTFFNVAKATVFTIPFVYAGAIIGDAPGILVGQSIGAVIVALAGWYWCAKWINQLAVKD